MAQNSKYTITKKIERLFLKLKLVRLKNSDKIFESYSKFLLIVFIIFLSLICLTIFSTNKKKIDKCNKIFIENITEKGFQYTAVTLSLGI